MIHALFSAFTSKETIKRAAPIVIFSLVLSVVLIMFALSFKVRNHTAIIPLRNAEESNRPIPPGDYKVDY